MRVQAQGIEPPVSIDSDRLDLDNPRLISAVVM
jgi:hypothetical protein